MTEQATVTETAAEEEHRAMIETLLKHYKRFYLKRYGPPVEIRLGKGCVIPWVARILMPENPNHYQLFLTGSRCSETGKVEWDSPNRWSRAINELSQWDWNNREEVPFSI